MSLHMPSVRAHASHQSTAAAIWRQRVSPPGRLLHLSLYLPHKHTSPAVGDSVCSVSEKPSLQQVNLCLQEKGFSSHNSYSLSKLAMQLYTFRLAELVKASGSKVTVNTCDPGTVNTKMLYAGWGACGIDLKVCTWLPGSYLVPLQAYTCRETLPSPCRSTLAHGPLTCGHSHHCRLAVGCNPALQSLHPAPFEGSAGSVQDANTEFQLATEPKLGTGKYFVGGRQSGSSGTATNKANQEKLWDILHEQTGADYNFLQPQ